VVAYPSIRLLAEIFLLASHPANKEAVGVAVYPRVVCMVEIVESAKRETARDVIVPAVKTEELFV
jgi:hypothetical protein